MASAAPNMNPMQRGFVPFDGDDASFPGWVTLTRVLMQKSGLGKIMSGKEQPPEALTGDETPEARAAHATAMEKYAERNGELYVRLLMSTSEGDGGFFRAASLVVQRYGPIGDAEYGNGRAAFVALEKKYKAAGPFRLKQLHNQLASVAVTAADDSFDPSRAIQELRRISTELGALGDVVVNSRLSNALLDALPDSHYSGLKTVLVCDEQNSADGTIAFEKLALRATTFHAMQIRGTGQAAMVGL